jgi:hypothetical protein
VEEIAEFAFLGGVFDDCAFGGENEGANEIICMTNGLMAPEGVIQSDSYEEEGDDGGEYQEDIFEHIV